MKPLINTPKWLWVLLAIFLFVAVAFTLFLLTYKIETTIETSLKTEGTTKSLYVNSEIAYKINKSNMVHLRINDKIYSTLISSISYERDLKLYKLNLSNLSIDLLPESTIRATIITGKQTIGSFLFGSV